MATLLRGNQATPMAEGGRDAKPATQTPESERRAERALLKLSLVLADVLLAVLAACLVWRKGSFGLLEIALCVLALALGAWLTCLALWFGKDKDPNS